VVVVVVVVGFNRVLMERGEVGAGEGGSGVSGTVFRRKESS